MATAALSVPAPAAVSRAPSRRRWRDVVVMTRRNLQPVLFTLLFIYVFGSGVAIANGSYKDFAVAGLRSLNLTTSAIGTAVGISSDLNSGVIDRLRTLPMWRPAILVGRSISDVASAALCLCIVVATGLAIGWRPHAGAGDILAGLAIPLLFSYALSWACGCLGLVSRGPESAQSIGLIVLFPLAIVSNAMVPTQHMPTWLRAIADWNPISAVTAACRSLLGNPNPSASLHVWPMEHPVAAALLWSVAIIAACAPLASWLYRRRTTE